MIIMLLQSLIQIGGKTNIEQRIRRALENIYVKHIRKYSTQGAGLRLLVSMRFQVLFHSPFRGSFHLSLTVLVHYRSHIVFSLAA